MEDQVNNCITYKVELQSIKASKDFNYKLNFIFGNNENLIKIWKGNNKDNSMDVETFIDNF